MKTNVLKLISIILFISLVTFGLYISNKKVNKKTIKRIVELERTIDQLGSKVDQRVNEQITREKGISQRITEVVMKEHVPDPTFADLLKTYTVYDATGPIKLFRNGKFFDGGYIVPDIAFKNADALLGYGVAGDISFEEQFSEKYNKDSYGFDCSIDHIDINNKLTHFIPECISTNEFIGSQSGSLKATSFTQQLKNLSLEGKKLFIKMDIEGAEYGALPIILKNAKDITGIVIELHLDLGEKYKLSQTLEKAMELLSRINQDFFLVNVHGNNCGIRSNNFSFTTTNAIGNVPKLLELTYINKNLAIGAHLSADQSHPSKIDMPNCPDFEDTNFEILIKSN